MAGWENPLIFPKDRMEPGSYTSAGTLANPKPGFIDPVAELMTLFQSMAVPSSQVGTPIPMANPMQAEVPQQGYGGFDPTPLLLMAQDAMGGVPAYDTSVWTTPGANLQGPLPRGPEQNPMQNIGAGMLNGIINLPATMWQAYSGAIGQPFANAIAPMIEGTGEAIRWATTPEGEYQQPGTQPEMQGPPMPGFRPGLPQQGGGAASPASPTVQRIMGAENSTGNSAAQNPNSSAMGNGQFIKSTWLEYANEVHPEWKDSMTEAQILQLRADPKYSAEATSWYAGKAVDVLDSIDAPATDANIYLHHFLGPLGVKSLLLADPSLPVSKVLKDETIQANPTILGGATTVQDVLDWAAAKMGDYTPGPPAARPQVVMPDFSAAEHYMQASAPQAMNPAMLADARLANMLAGLGAGIGGVNVHEQGGGALFGSMAAGTGEANARNQQMALDFENQYNQANQAWNASMANWATKKAGMEADAQNTNAERAWQDHADRQGWNLQESARNAIATAPTIVESSADGLWVQSPDGGLQFLPTPETTQYEDLAKTFGMDTGIARQLKYQTMATQPGMNILTFQQEIAKDILADGMGPSVWGESYLEALAAAEEMVPEGMAATPDKMQEAIIKMLPGLLLGASQQAGDFDWILQAASLGNPGAIILTQNGTQGIPQ